MVPGGGDFPGWRTERPHPAYSRPRCLLLAQAELGPDETTEIRRDDGDPDGFGPSFARISVVRLADSSHGYRVRAGAEGDRAGWRRSCRVEDRVAGSGLLPARIPTHGTRRSRRRRTDGDPPGMMAIRATSGRPPVGSPSFHRRTRARRRRWCRVEDRSVASGLLPAPRPTPGTCRRAAPVPPPGTRRGRRGAQSAAARVRRA